MTTRSKATPAASAGSESVAEAPAPKRRTSTRAKASTVEPAAEASIDGSADAAPKRRATRKKAEPA
jgi:hypothetical protein